MIAWDDNIWGDEWVTFPHVRPPIGVKPSRNLEVRIGQRRYIENLKQRRHRPEDLNTKAKYSGTSLSRTSDIMYRVLQTRKKHVMPKFYCTWPRQFFVQACAYVGRPFSMVGLFGQWGDELNADILLKCSCKDCPEVTWLGRRASESRNLEQRSSPEMLSRFR